MVSGVLTTCSRACTARVTRRSHRDRNPRKRGFCACGALVAQSPFMQKLLCLAVLLGACATDVEPINPVGMWSMHGAWNPGDCGYTPSVTGTFRISARVSPNHAGVLLVLPETPLESVGAVEGPILLVDLWNDDVNFDGGLTSMHAHYEATVSDEPASAARGDAGRKVTGQGYVEYFGVGACLQGFTLFGGLY